MRILITRPKSDNDKLKTLLEDDGHTVLSSPMLEIENRCVPPLTFDHVQGIIFTSRNGLRAVAESSQIAQLQQLRVYAVGEATARVASSFGFSDVVVGPGRASGLVDAIRVQSEPQTGLLIHFRGDDVAFDVAGALTGHGFDVQSFVVYAARRATALSRNVENALRDGVVDAVILMSPKTAQTFAEIISKSGLREAARKLKYACISEATARELSGLDAAGILVAARPEIAQLRAVINRI